MSDFPVFGGSTASAVALLATRTYNKGRRSRKLAETRTKS